MHSVLASPLGWDNERLTKRIQKSTRICHVSRFSSGGCVNLGFLLLQIQFFSIKWSNFKNQKKNTCNNLRQMKLIGMKEEKVNFILNLVSAWSKLEHGCYGAKTLGCFLTYLGLRYFKNLNFPWKMRCLSVN